MGLDIRVNVTPGQVADECSETPADGCEWEGTQAAIDLHSHLISHGDSEGYYLPDDAPIRPNGT